MGKFLSEYAIPIRIMIVCLLLLLSYPAWEWYKAGVQQEVYAREGIHMTQWEVFVGARPAERTINIKEKQ